MAAKKTAGKKKLKFVFIHKLAASTSLLALIVITLGGVLADASVIWITFRAFAVVTVVGIISRILIRAWASYEEISRGKN